MTTTFKLTKKRLDKLELIDYIYQVKVTDLWCLRKFEDKLSELSRKKFRKNLNQENEIKKLLKSQNLLPKQIYYYNDLKITDMIESGEASVIFTGIKQVSFDQGGLIVLEHFNNDVYTLRNKNGEVLLKTYCSELNIGTNGLIEFRIEGNTEETESLNELGPLRYGLIQNGKFIEISDQNKFNYETFPNIYDRDKVPLMDNWIKSKYTKSKLKNLTDNSTIINILNEDGTLIRYMSDTVRENEKYCKLSIEQNELTFTLIPEKLQKDKSFVTKLYSSNKVPLKINRFFDSSLKEDVDIIKIEKKKRKSQDDIMKEWKKGLLQDKISIDDLPF